MKSFPPFRPAPQAFTLVEMTVVIMVMMALITVGLSVSGGSKKAMLAREASESLRTVYTAQRLYLSDNPLAPISSLTPELLLPYLPNQATAIPTVKSLTGTTLKIKLNVFPPVVNNGSDAAYDPSGNSKDSLWDVGE